MNLVGGYYDGGDHVKFGLPMAFATTMLSWSAVDFKTELVRSNQMGPTLEAIKWGTDYFIKAHPQPNVLWGQVNKTFYHKLVAPPTRPPVRQLYNYFFPVLTMAGWRRSVRPLLLGACRGHDDAKDRVQAGSRASRVGPRGRNRCCPGRRLPCLQALWFRLLRSSASAC